MKIIVRFKTKTWDASVFSTTVCYSLRALLLFVARMHPFLELFKLIRPKYYVHFTEMIYYLRLVGFSSKLYNLISRSRDYKR